MNIDKGDRQIFLEKLMIAHHSNNTTPYSSHIYCKQIENTGTFLKPNSSNQWINLYEFIWNNPSTNLYENDVWRENGPTSDKRFRRASHDI